MIFIKKITGLLLTILCLGNTELNAKTFTIGSISPTPATEISLFQPLAEYIVKHLRALGYDTANVGVSDSIAGMSGMLSAGKIDIYIDSPSPMIKVHSKTGCVIFLRRWKEGISGYQAAILVRKDSGINKVDDLKGKLIAFEHPYSTSGFAMPVQYLKHLKFTVTEDSLTPVSKMQTNIRYVFSEEDQNTIVWVLQDRVQAGAMRLTKYEEFLKLNPALKNELKTIYESITLPRHLVCYRKELDQKVVNELTDILTHMAEDKEGKLILDNLEHTLKFDVYPGNDPEHQATLKELIKMYSIE